MKRILQLATIFLLVLTLSGCEPLYKEVDSVWANDHQVEALQAQIDSMYTTEQIDELQAQLDALQLQLDSMYTPEQLNAILLTQSELLTEYMDELYNELLQENLALQTRLDEMVAQAEIDQRIEDSYILALENRLYAIEQQGVEVNTTDFTIYEYYDRVETENGLILEITVEYQRHYEGLSFTGLYNVISITYCSDTCTVLEPFTPYSIADILKIANEWFATYE